MSTNYFLLTKKIDDQINNNANNQIIDISMIENKKIFILPSNFLTYYKNNGFSEKNLIEWSTQLCSPDKVFLDIGAHTGTYTISLANRCSCVYSFEPQKMTYYALCGSVALSNLKNVTCLQIGLGSEDQIGINKLKIISDDGGGSSLHITDASKILKEEEIEIRTLDSFNINNIGFIKMDVEDNELFVLKGANETLKNSNYPKILFECNDIFKSQELFNYITNLNYKIIKIQGAENMYLAEYDAQKIPKEISIDVSIYIFWHIFIDTKGLERGINIIQRQFNKMINSGLLDKCKTLYIGYVSCIDFPCENIINHPKVKIIATKDVGNEGVTTKALKEFCDLQNDENLILYIHNRGISHFENSPSDYWTFMMEYFVIERWEHSIQLLKNKYTCGCELWSHGHRINLNDFIFHYSGNFWWSRCSYIKLLNYPNFDNRYSESEDWILELAGHGIDKEHFGILHRTSKNKYERGMVHSYIDNYPLLYYKSGQETPDIEIDPDLFHGEHCTNGFAHV
jgi:FkbM family methyltransferase